ncbi:putative phage tail assembly chaperone [Pseudomonas sp. R5(2019)]|uniref:putative phage tail assembly chaperone n=1 Tax=Pseudomonas sp. R5(2019) TaxID=2697566 RepID=UPI001412F3F0|nr:putative phage tail assembly chaperone [Pseudomonas sp. R5(2019)]NBA97971.1 hypothetical protein [Pseudomonas sp. R5(2019)]
MTERSEITLEVGEQEFNFTLTPQDVTKYFNSMTASNKVSPSHNLLVNTVAQDERTALKEALKNPVMTMQLAGALMEEYAPNVEVLVKKRSATLNA